MPPDGGVSVRNLQFYVHDVELLGADGKDYVYGLADMPPWQGAGVALIDLAGAPGGRGNAALRGRPSGRPAGGFDGVRFVVGVPFELNHANPLTAAAPLNRSDLFWVWQTGYKFLRAELAEEGTEWAFHVGSTGCASASAVRAPSADCAQPNRIVVEIRGLDPLREAVQLRLSELVRAMRAAGHEVCVGNYAHTPACAAPLATLGFGQGAGAQRLFGAAR